MRRGRAVRAARARRARIAEPGKECRGSRDAADGGDVPPDRVLVPVRRSPRALTRRAAREAAAERGREQERGQRRGGAGRNRPTDPDERADRSRGRRGSRTGSGTTGTGSRRGRRTRSPASRSGRTTRRSRAGSSGTSPWTRTASQFTKPTTNAAIPRSVTQTSSGIASRRRKKTVSRVRPRVVVANDEADRPVSGILPCAHSSRAPAGAALAKRHELPAVAHASMGRSHRDRASRLITERGDPDGVSAPCRRRRSDLHAAALCRCSLRWMPPSPCGWQPSGSPQASLSTRLAVTSRTSSSSSGLPGWPVYRALVAQPGGLWREIVFGWSLGYLLEILAFFVTAASGLRGVFYLYPLVDGVPAAAVVW